MGPMRSSYSFCDVMGKSNHRFMGLFKYRRARHGKPTTIKVGVITRSHLPRPSIQRFNLNHPPVPSGAA